MRTTIGLSKKIIIVYPKSEHFQYVQFSQDEE